jgi:hypothetical protein
VVSGVEPLEDLLSLGVLLLAVRHLLGRPRLASRDWVDLGLLGSAVRDQQAGHYGHQHGALGLHQPEKTLHLAMVLHDQVNDVLGHGGVFRSAMYAAAPPRFAPSEPLPISSSAALRARSLRGSSR